MFAVVGESLVDVVVTAHGEKREHPGGSPANVALGLARLGHQVTLTTQLAEDEYGRLVRAHLESSDVVVDTHPTERTSVARACVDEAGVAAYTFDISWHVGTLGLPAAVTCLHTGSLALALDPGAERVRALMHEARQAGVLVTYDPNVRPALAASREDARRRVESAVALADLVKVSDEDLEFCYPGRTFESVAEQWLQSSGPVMVVVTRGQHGAHGATTDCSTQVRPQQVDMVDTVGAGDAFMSGLLDALARRGLLLQASADRLGTLTPSELTAVLDEASLAAVLTCGRPGADPPSRAELDAALSRL